MEIELNYFNQWVRFSESIKSRSSLLTITDYDIYIVEKIFDSIKKLKGLH